MTAPARPVIVRGTTDRLPLADDTVDLIVTSPPYHGLRDYGYGGQVGAEGDVGGYLERLWDITGELARVLRPTGSLFINLGDTFSDRANNGPSVTQGSSDGGVGRGDRHVRVPRFGGVRRKSLYGLPWMYAHGVTGMLAAMGGPDPQLNLILRRDLIWEKENPIPESVDDRCTSAHEYVFHFTRQGDYYAALDELREPHTMRPQRRPNGHRARQQLGVLPAQTYSTSVRDDVGVDGHPLGRAPRSVWRIPSEPLQPPLVPAFYVPDGDRWEWVAMVTDAWWLLDHGRIPAASRWPRDDRDRGLRVAPQHHAAFPSELPRRIILGWSPHAICLDCGRGRTPVVEVGPPERYPGGGGTYRAMRRPGEKDTNLAEAALRPRRIVGYACPCCPHTNHPGQGRPSPTAGSNGRQPTRPPDIEATHQRVGPWIEYHLDRWARRPPSRAAVVLDPMGGLGTTALVASQLGRVGISVDLSMNYSRLARYRASHDPGKAARRTWSERQGVLL